MAELETVFAGLKLRNPIIVGSCGLSESIENVYELEKQGAAAIVLKSLFEEEILKDLNARLGKMSSESLIYPETLDYYDYYETYDGPEEATVKYLNHVAGVKKAVSIPVIASINCITASQWTYFPKNLEQAGADAIELNIFLLPSDLNRTAEENETVYFDIIREVAKQVSIPVIVKLSHYFSNVASMLKKISESGIDGMVLFNRFYNPDIDLKTMEFTSGAVLSSPSDLYTTLRWIGILSGRLGCSLAASTGVHDGAGLIKQILAGADAVEIASTLYRNGMHQIALMLEELEKWMAEHQFDQLNQFRGRMSQANAINPAAYERVQFMKYFRGFQADY